MTLTQRNQRNHHTRRPGAAIVMMLVCIIGLFGLLALAIELGVVAVARSQAQNAADGAAMTGARTINGNPDQNYRIDDVPTNSFNSVDQNYILGQKIGVDKTKFNSAGTDAYGSGPVKVELGTYAYTYNDSNPSDEKFNAQFPRTDSSEPYSAVRATVTGNANFNFARVFGISSKAVQATAVAVHRPRDVFIIMDLSGSMRFQSLIGIPYSGSRTTSMNPDPDYPKFGHYSDTSGAALFGNTSMPAGTGEFYDPANITVATNSGPAIAEYFFSNASGVPASSSNRAFKRSSSDYSTTPGGDNYLKTSLNTGTDYAATIREFNNNSTNTNPKFELNGYASVASKFHGYTEGPGYWGKTFWIWPPCPGSPTVDAPSSIANTTFNWYDNGARDWRQRFYVAVKTSQSNAPAWLYHNTILFDSSGNLKTPGTTTSVSETVNGSTASTTYSFRINYAAILYWLKQSPVHFPDTLQAGRIRYYTAIPDGKDNSLNNRWWTTAPQNLPNNERFWKEYIDFVLGYTASETTASSYTDRSSYIGNGDVYSWGTNSVSNQPQPQTASNKPIGPYTTGVTGAHQTGQTGPYQTTTTSSSRSTGNTSIPVNSLSITTTGNVNHVQFGTNSTVYKITNNSKTSLTISPGLAANLSSGSAVKVYSTNNAAGVTQVSVTGLSSNPTNGSDYVAFAGSTSNLRLISGGTQTQLTVSSGIASAISLSGANVEIFGSNGTVGSSLLSVSGISQAPTVNRDYIVVDGDTANPYLVTAVLSGNNGYRLTISPSLAKAVNIKNAKVEVYSPIMNYTDNVRRPKYHFWFGPATFIDWLGNYNTGKFGWPGNVPEAQNWACKVGIQTAIDDIKNNHPNDFIGMCFFSTPRTSRTGSGSHNRAIIPLGRNYQQLKDTLWFPPSTIDGSATEITPYDEDFDNVPRAQGGTAPGMGFMIAYNQLSGSANNLRNYATPTNTYRGNAGGLGRRGAERIIIFETDGVPNSRATATFNNAGTDSYYSIRVKNPSNISSTSNTEWPSAGSYSINEIYDVVKQITALDTASSPGHSTARRDVKVFPVGYGSLFDPANSSTQQSNALTFLQNVAYHGNTATTTNGSDFPDGFRIYGTSAQRISRMQAAFTNIMQTGTQVTLIE